MDRHIVRTEEDRTASKMLTGKPTGKRPLGKAWRRWADNISMDVKERYVSRGIWIHYAQDRDY